MPEIDFDGLRAHVENATYLPEFREVQKRARRVRRRNRLRVLIAVAAVTVPAVAAADAMYRQTPRGNAVTMTNDGNTVVHLAMPTPKSVPSTWTLVAADGVDLSHMFGLVDVCAGAACEMEISSIDPGGILGDTQRIGLFRNSVSDRVTDARVVAVNTDTVIISARVNGGPVQTQTLSLSALPGKTPKTGARAVQATPSGEIQLAGANGSITPLPTPPPLTSPRLVTTMAGWWVAGIDPVTSMPGLAVSRDSGHTWSTRPVNLTQLDVTPAIAEVSGALYMLTTSDGRMTLSRSTDDGHTWTALRAAFTWPASSQYGLVVAKDKSLIAWFTTTSGTTILASKDGGATFSTYRNPGPSAGPILAVNGGFLMLGNQPALSHDGVSWATAAVPWLPMR